MVSIGDLLFCSFLFYFSITVTSSTILNNINPTQSLKDGDTLVSATQIFELGFFSLADPKIKFLGLWYKKISHRTIVWVANREAPLSNSFGSLNITNQGNLVLVNATNHVLWWSKITRTAKNPVAQILDSGNFVVRDGNDNNSENFLWQSFDYPADTQLPGMKLGGNLVTGLKWYLSSWKSTEDPSPGQFSLHVDLNGYPQLLIRKQSEIVFRAGSWNGQSFTGSPTLRSNPLVSFEFVVNKGEVYYRYKPIDKSALSKFVLNPTGLVQHSTWNDKTRDWMVFASARQDQCENYNYCGAFSNCDINKSPVCNCLNGFIPKSQSSSDGCVRRTPLQCNDKDRFWKHIGIKLPDTSSSWFDRNIDLKECERLCFQNCSCTAYSNLDITGDGSGCLLWFDELTDIRDLVDATQNFYVRIAASELDKYEKKKLPGYAKAGLIAACVIFGTMMLLFYYICRRTLRKYGIVKNTFGRNDSSEDMDLPLFNLITISEATNEFSSSNKLGEGGFGPVYRGTLKEGQEIAVKRLSKSSGQGLIEFKNEVILIAKLQHRNLVKLLGCCNDGEEKMLIYEYMPNKSLDFFIFGVGLIKIYGDIGLDQTKSKLLDWPKRMHIISGIARGLLYLHQDSRLRIIHRDLKASNILLDSDMNPKISDFGLARIFGADQTEQNTQKVVGTYGYMAPEYAVDGLFSVKSDVFSYGVLVLELVSGKRNRGFCHAEHDLNLLGHAWMLWTKGAPLELIDENLTDSAVESEVVRCINMSLLCVQKRPEDRPSMSSVAVMLSSENPLPEPKQPGFFMERNPPEADTSANKHQSHSANEVSITLLEAR